MVDIVAGILAVVILGVIVGIGFWKNRNAGGGGARAARAAGSRNGGFLAAEKKQFHDLLLKKQFREAESLLARLASDDDRAVVLLCGENVRRYLEATADWTLGSEFTPAALNVRGALLIRWGWEARGTDKGETVGEDAFRLIFERLEQSNQFLVNSANASPQDALPLILLLITLRGLQAPFEDLNACFQEGLRREPTSWRLHVNFMTYLQKKWFGSHEQMFGFAREVASKSRDGSHLLALVPMAHLEYAFYLSAFEDDKNWRRYFDRREVKLEVMAAWRRFQTTPATRNDTGYWEARNTFALALGYCGETAAAAIEMQEIGENITELPWDNLGNAVEVFHATLSQWSR